MGNTVSATFKPSGGIVSQRSPESAATVAPAEDRTITYPLRGGGFLVAECPDWCFKDHAGDIEGGIYAEDLVHESAPVSVGFAVQGERDVILAASIRQWPFATDGNGSDRPHMALLPVHATGEDLGYQTPTDVDAAIFKVRKHLVDLQRLNDQLAAARAVDYSTHGGTWENLSRDDLKTMPIASLLKLFGARVEEGSPDGFETLDAFFMRGKPGDWTILISRELSQYRRGLNVRAALTELHARYAR
ncbi:DUF6907 domain-containing protein [Streptomyces sp. LN785]|uniref:DUF6907 domain-containing protein n=1 Tax=Streptomyces sp. LN785 TaxID=3112983 RepID=UPI003711E6CD